jgi:16S rRNA pseudouridine516 synthase
MIRLDKALSHMGLGSRKEVKEYIRKGYIVVNGEVIKSDDFKINPDEDEIIIDGETFKYDEYVYLMLNKPQGVISATMDSRYETVVDLCAEYRKYNIFPVGRLDIDTTGLLILTNDGELAHKLLSPKYHVFKKYYVKFKGVFKDSYINDFKEGIVIDGGYKCMPSKVEKISSDEAYVWIREGKFHQVKRMFQSLNMEVVELERVSFGKIDLDSSLERGSYRKLTEDELNLLKSELE